MWRSSALVAAAVDGHAQCSVNYSYGAPAYCPPPAPPCNVVYCSAPARRWFTARHPSWSAAHQRWFIRRIIAVYYASVIADAGKLWGTGKGHPSDVISDGFFDSPRRDFTTRKIRQSALSEKMLLYRDCRFLPCFFFGCGACGDFNHFTAPANNNPGQQIAQTISLITGVAISPLMGVGVVGAWQYFQAKTPEQKAKLPWFANPSVLGSGVAARGCVRREGHRRHRPADGD